MSEKESVKRYEGHTPEPWEWKTTPGSEHERCTVYVKHGTAVARHVAIVDAPLIADAPVLAAWVVDLDDRRAVLKMALKQEKAAHNETAGMVAEQAATIERLRDGVVNLIAEFVPMKHKLAAAARLAALKEARDG